MEVILKQDIPNLGHKDDIVKVKNGYANNYLIPKGYASLASTSARKVHAENLKQRAHKEESIRLEAVEIADKLAGLNLIIGAKTSSSGKIFGSVNTIQISEALTEKGFDIDRKKISIEGDQVKEIGKYKATIRLHRDVRVDVDFEIIAE
ncbi:MAG: 50S ribosomal protein L9 [Bacteroidales bacterium]|jgi:large subunit ribosomal protein L9|nr:50S ribosomal protein L9 [Bacteroidales bacterium]